MGLYAQVGGVAADTNERASRPVRRSLTALQAAEPRRMSRVESAGLHTCEWAGEAEPRRIAGGRAAEKMSKVESAGFTLVVLTE